MNRTAAPLALAAATTAGILITAPWATSAAPGASSAYGIAVTGGGQEVVPPSPYVESTDGSTQTGGGDVPENPLASGGVLRVTAGNNQASAEVTDLTLGGAVDQLPEEVKQGLTNLQQACEGVGQVPVDELPDILGQVPGLPDQPTQADLEGFCTSLFDGTFAQLATVQALNISCEGSTGKVTLVGASVLGAEAPVNGEVEPGTALFPDNPVLAITLNRQTENADGSFTVDGLVVDLGGGQGELVVGSATCAEVGVGGGTPNPPTAPSPDPVPRNVPVTG